MTNKILASEQDVHARIDDMARDIVRDFSDKKPLFVALLRGAAPFASQLMFAIAKTAPDFHPEIDYMMVRTYGSGQHAGKPRIITDLAPDTDISQRPVIILDDVLDKGITAHFVSEHLKAKGASDIRLAVLADKQTTREQSVEADYVGFSVADVWLIGMGMDNAGSGKEHDRWLGSIEAIVQ